VLTDGQEYPLFGMWRRGFRLENTRRGLTAVEMALRQALRSGILRNGTNVLLRSDNTPTCNGVNRCAAKALGMQRVMTRVLRVMRENKIRMKTVHVKGEKNEKADSLSRLSYAGDYRVKPDVLRAALQKLRTMIQIDWFTRKANAQYPRYCTLRLDRGAYARDAIDQDWTRFRGLVHPPLPMVVGALTKIAARRATAVMIVPMWTRAIWAPLLRLMTVRSVVMGPTTKVLEMGTMMRKKGAKLPPDLLGAYLVQG
jgi:hypothetical protein